MLRLDTSGAAAAAAPAAPAALAYLAVPAIERAESGGDLASQYTSTCTRQRASPAPAPAHASSSCSSSKRRRRSRCWLRRRRLCGPPTTVCHAQSRRSISYGVTDRGLVQGSPAVAALDYAWGSRWRAGRRSELQWYSLRL